MNKKIYRTNGYAVHKKTFLVLFSIWIIDVVCAFFMRTYELINFHPKLVSLIPYIMLLIIMGYITYMLKNTHIELIIDDNGITYKSARRKGLKFKRFSSFVPWSSVKTISVFDKKKGPIHIETADGEFIYKNIVTLEENKNIAEELISRFKDKRT